jgi:hypothetical protein
LLFQRERGVELSQQPVGAGIEVREVALRIAEDHELGHIVHRRAPAGMLGLRLVEQVRVFDGGADLGGQCRDCQGVCCLKL